MSQNLILDLDGTLIDAQSPTGANSALVLGRGAPAHVCGPELGHLRIYKRPGLDAFLDWCFDNFSSVGIWTLSTPEWLNEVLDHVLPHVPRDKWSLLWTGERATRLQSKTHDAVAMNGVPVLKDLKKVFKNKGLRQRGLTRWNTLIVEDSPSNCLRNYGNAIYVRPFDILSQQRDEELHYLKTYFQRTLHGCANVRQVDKQSWRQEIENEEKSSKQPQAKNSESVAFWMTDSWKSNLIDLATRSLKL